MTSSARFSATRPAVLFAALLLVTWLIASPVAAQQNVLRDGAILDSIETPSGTLYKIHRVRPHHSFASPGRGPILPSFAGDTYSFEHQLGALIDEIFKCFEMHHSGMGDNTVTFDGFTEELDPYTNGTQPGIFEFESNGLGGPMQTNVFINSFADGDLFPEGFEDPETGTPLSSACFEIGIDDTLDSDVPTEVSSAMIEASDSQGNPVLPPIDITSFFESPFDGRLSIVFSGIVGQGIDGVVLDIQTEFDPQPIFSDGFESGNTSSWTSEVP